MNTLAIHDLTELEELLSRPNERVIAAVQRMPGRWLFVGAAGKMGPSLTRMVVRAAEAADVSVSCVAVSRFSDPAVRKQLEANGIKTLAGDLLDDAFVRQLPDADQVVFMTGAKFGASQQQARTWAMNTDVPAQICRRYPDASILAFSSGNIYGYVSTSSKGSRETDPLDPVGEYANTVLGRERMFEYFSQRNGTRVALARLNYACDMRYGVLVDIARQVIAQKPIDLTMGHVNVIWQGDANRHSLCALADADTPPWIINIAGTPVVSVRDVAERFAERLACEVKFVGSEAERSLLNDASQAHQRYGAPEICLDQMITWTADWMTRGMEQWNKPTHFQNRSGAF